ncbi:LiaF domain-containing protein [Lachnoclostridium sp.]|uniref:LiaF domain-containing protein n=1 Tax=Lachnoclostridium sp. TaxID=2028282 RepID=UPI00289BE598|nr:LiaF domain-containing protein [Lachnoclostridium sp.]
MRYRISNVLWGLFWMSLGIIIAGNVFQWWDISLFFPGWWTLFLIVPCGISIIRSGFGGFSLIGLVVGIMLLLNCQGIFLEDTVRKLIVPVVLIIIGLNILMRTAFNGSSKVQTPIPKECSYAATFSGNTVQFPNQRFQGAELNSIFGGVRLDLRSAIIEENVCIDATSIFGGIDIFVPDNVRIKVSSSSFFGGVSNHRRRISGEVPTIYINATCMFGGVDIR